MNKPKGGFLSITGLREVVSSECLMKIAVHLIVILLAYQYSFNIRPWLNSLTLNNGYPPYPNFISADPFVYWKYATTYGWSEIPLNIFGPVYFAKIFFCNFDAIFIANLAILILSIKCFAQRISQSNYLVLIVLLINPAISSQVFFVNKELYMIISALLFLSTTRTKSWIFAAACLMALFTKIEFLAVVGLWLVLRKQSYLVIVYSLFALIGAISIFYSFIPGMADKESVLTYASKNSQSIGLSSLWQYLATEYHLFFLVIVPRVLQASSAGIVELFRGGISVLKNGWVTVISSFIFTSMLAWIVTLKRKVTAEVIFLSLWFVVSATLPFAIHRYLFPCYPFMYFIILKREQIYEKG
ncbi:hypothetical protein HW988_08690 [Bdellovibrio sp. KM01]|nr:hypothetical protein HW988_08690 [Bdellovibrio sp. KM01]